MKLAHTSDLHIVKPDHISVLALIVELANGQKCEHLLVAGDLFDSNAAAKACQSAVSGEFEKFNGSVWIIPGNHDSELASFFRVTRGLVFRKPEAVRLSPGLTLVGVPFVPHKGFFDLLIEKAVERQTGASVLLLHGTLISRSGESSPGEYFPVSSNDLKRFGCAYAAMGHYHVPFTEKMDGLLAVNPGSPRVTRTSDTGKRKFVVYDTERASVRDIHLPVPYNEQVTVRVDFLMDRTVLEERITAAARKVVDRDDSDRRLATFVVKPAGTISLDTDELTRTFDGVARAFAKENITLGFDVSGVRQIGDDVLGDPAVKELLSAVSSGFSPDEKDEAVGFTLRLLSAVYAGTL